MLTFKYTGGPSGTLVVNGTKHWYLRLLDGTLHPIPDPVAFGKRRATAVELLSDRLGSTPDRKVGYLVGDEAAFLLAADVTFTPDALVTKAEYDALFEALKAANAKLEAGRKALA